MIARFLCALLVAAMAPAAWSAERLRVIVETDAGGDPDDEQSLVRFLLYANEWDVEGIIANRPRARDGENRNPRRTGLEIVRGHLAAYGRVHDKLRLHDPRYPTEEALRAVTAAGYDDVDDGVQSILRAVDRDDPRPVWFMNWGTDHGAAESCLKRALDRVLKQRGADGYARFKRKLRLSSADKFGDHTWKIDPPFVLWTYPMMPDMDGGRWYHRFSPLTKDAGGFDLKRDVLEGHGPLGALYPTNTNRPQKEGDSLLFLNLIPNGLNEPERPDWGSWSGRGGLREEAGGRRYYWANVRDVVDGKAHRDHTLSRWAAHLQNDFRARMDWCVADYAGANHPPVVVMKGDVEWRARAGDPIELDVTGSSDPDGDKLSYRWMIYPEAGGYQGTVPELSDPQAARASLRLPADAGDQALHVIVVVTDNGSPPLTRYGRRVVKVSP